MAQGDSNSAHIFAPGIYSNPTRIMAPPKAIPVLGQMEAVDLFKSQTYGLVDAISEQGPRPEFNNGPEMTQIVAAFQSSSVYSSPTRIMVLPQAIPILGQVEDTSFQVSYLRFPGGCHIWPRAAGLTSIMAKEVIPILAPFWTLGVYFSPTRIRPLPAIPILLQMGHTSFQISCL